MTLAWGGEFHYFSIWRSVPVPDAAQSHRRDKLQWETPRTSATESTTQKRSEDSLQSRLHPRNISCLCYQLIVDLLTNHQKSKCRSVTEATVRRVHALSIRVTSSGSNSSFPVNFGSWYPAICTLAPSSALECGQKIIRRYATLYSAHPHDIFVIHDFFYQNLWSVITAINVPFDKLHFSREGEAWNVLEIWKVVSVFLRSFELF